MAWDDTMDGWGSSPLARGLQLLQVALQVVLRIIPARAGFTQTRTTMGNIPSGSSPLARGLPGLMETPRTPIRIIPARAGFTAGCAGSDHGGGDHPRSRGVYRPEPPRRHALPGSSPLARGLPPPVGEPCAGDRIIPARAGFTASRTRPGLWGRDHPRSRGVYRTATQAVASSDGSSPLARGLRVRPGRRCGWGGIIPARAGFTSAPVIVIGSPGDHPRSRGVYGSTGQVRAHPLGSSPLARGLPPDSESVWVRHRIIPARAGFTSGRPQPDGTRTDHPRSRGVYRCSSDRPDRPSGSSPLARGLRGRPVLGGLPHGIIPARAGFTVSWLIEPSWLRDHPRSRGVYPCRMSDVETPAGSSPLARGLPPPSPGQPGWTPDHPRSRGVYAVPVAGCAPGAGIIPARAGFTRRRYDTCTSGPDHPRSRGVYPRGGSERGRR